MPPYPRSCLVCPYMAVSELAFRRHLILHHQVMMETRDGSESFRRMDADEATQRSHTFRNRRRGRQCRLQAEAASRLPSPAAEAAPCRPSPDDRATNYLPAGYLSDTSSDRDVPAGGNGKYAGPVVRRPDFCVGGPDGAASPDATGSQTSPVC